MSRISYTLIPGKTINDNSSLAVKCNICAEICSFANTVAHEDVAFWTFNKSMILCPNCKESSPPVHIYRKVHEFNDLCTNRTTFFADSYNELLKVSQAEFTNSYYKHFCSPEEERRELTENPKKDPICSCVLCKLEALEHHHKSSELLQNHCC